MTEEWVRAAMLTMGEFRRLTAHIPDDAFLGIDEGDCEVWNATFQCNYPPVLDHPYLVVLGMNQVWTQELDYHHRMDARHALGDPE